MRLLSFQRIPTKLTSSSTPTLCFNPTPTFLGIIFDHTLSFSKHVSSLKAKFFPRLKALCGISASSWYPSMESLSLLYKTFLRSLLTYASPGWLPFLSVTNITKLEPFTELLVAPSPVSPLSHFYSVKRLNFPYESP